MKFNKLMLVGFMLILAGIALFTSGCQSSQSSSEYKGIEVHPPSPLPDFELIDTKGQPFRLSDVEGEVALLYFGYTHCPDVCPLTLLDIKEALTELKGREHVHVIFISLDPERDTPEVMARYLNNFDPEFIGLTGDGKTIQEVIKSYRVRVEKREKSGSTVNYLVSHTANFYLVTPRRELLLSYPFEVDPEDLRSDLQQLLQSIKS